MKIKLTGWDKKWSKLVRERDGHICQVCKKYSEYVNAHHVFTRSIKGLRLDPDNGITLCFQCHTANHTFSAHKTPEAFKRWFKKEYPDRWKVIYKKRNEYKSERQAVEEFSLLLEKTQAHI